MHVIMIIGGIMLLAGVVTGMMLQRTAAATIMTFIGMLLLIYPLTDLLPNGWLILSVYIAGALGIIIYLETSWSKTAGTIGVMSCLMMFYLIYLATLH